MTIARRLWLATAIIVLVLLIHNAAEVFVFQSYREVESLRTNGQAVLAHSESLLKDLQTAQSSERGYLLTQRSSYLGPYAGAKDGALGHLERLEELAPSWSIKPAVSALSAAVASEFADLDRGITLQESGRRSEALALASGGQDERFMDQAGKLAEQSAETLKLTLDKRAATANELYRVLWGYMFLAGPLVLIFLVVTIRLVTGQVKRSTSTLQAAMAAVSLSAHPKPISSAPSDELGSVVTAFNHMVERLAHEQAERSLAEDSLVASNLELSDRERTMNLLLQTSEQLATVKDQSEFAGVVQRFVPQIIRKLPGCLYVLDESRTSLEACATWNSPQWASESIPVQECFAACHGQAYFFAEADAELCPHAASCASRSSRCVPLMSQAEVIGVIYLEADQSAADLDEGDRQKLMLVSDTLGLALGNLRLRERLRTESVRDPLTDVFNRRFLNEVLAFELARASQTGQPFSLMMLDIDHFKHFNDVYGHETGDVVLKELAETLRRHSRKNDIVCRWGGEEFLLVFPTMDSEAAYERAEMLREAIKTIVIISEGRRVDQITASAGVATYPGAGLDAEGLTAAADRALYEAKHAGRDRVVIAHGSADTNGHS
ncbi:MAG: diguanylate cyclase [Vulcanimicrobiaceae bacterium]